MEKIKISKEKLIKIKETTIFVLLLIWFAMPILQTFKILYEIAYLEQFYFILMKIIGGVGITLSAFDIYDKLKKSENKKETLKQILPIFIFVIYMAWTLISCNLALNKNLAFNGDKYRKEGYLMYINYAGFFLCAFLFENKKLRKILLNTFIVASIFLILICRITSGGEYLSNIFDNTEIEDAVFLQFNHYGYYLMMSLICCLGLFIAEKNKHLKIVYLIAYTLIGYATIYNNTFGCYLAICVFLILYGIYALIKKIDRKTIFSAIIIFVILSCITVKDGKNLAYENLKEFAFDIKSVITKLINWDVENKEINKNFANAGTFRMALWKNGIKFIAEKPIIGYGPDNLEIRYQNIGINQDRPHNLLIYLATVSGIPGMVIYLTAVGIIVIKGIKKLLAKNENGKIFLMIIITYLVSSMFGNSMYYTSPYFFIFLGCLMNCNLQKKEE